MLVVLSDIHGCIRSLDKLLNKLFSKYDISKFIILGDFIGKGLHSLEVTKELITISQQYNFLLIRGNHEDMFLNYIRKENRYSYSKWKKYYGEPIIKSFTKNKLIDFTSISQIDLLPYVEKYLPFIESSIDYVIEDVGSIKYLFSHAGVHDLKQNINNQYDGLSKKYKLIKYPFIHSRKVMKFTSMYYDYRIVHGHTPSKSWTKESIKDRPMVRTDENNNIININLDLGLGWVYGGNLAAMIISHTGDFTFEVVKCMD